MVREGVEDVGVPGMARVNQTVWDNRIPSERVIPRLEFVRGYRDGSLGIFMLEKLNDKRFLAWGEDGSLYTCSVNDKVVTMYKNG